jgi:hypothetical protein
MGRKSQVQEWVRFACAIQFRASFDLEPHVQVETQRLFVLFVHIQCRRAERIYGISDQLLTDSGPSPIGMDKEHFDLALSDSHKSRHQAFRVAHTG